MTRTLHAVALPEPTRPMSYQEAYDTGLPVAIPRTGVLPVRPRPVHPTPTRLQAIASGAWAVVSLAAAGSVLLLLVLVVIRVAGVLA
jgi:hypothetical protein